MNQVMRSPVVNWIGEHQVRWAVVCLYPVDVVDVLGRC